MGNIVGTEETLENKKHHQRFLFYLVENRLNLSRDKAPINSLHFEKSPKTFPYLYLEKSANEFPLSAIGFSRIRKKWCKRNPGILITFLQCGVYYVYMIKLLMLIQYVQDIALMVFFYRFVFDRESLHKV